MKTSRIQFDAGDLTQAHLFLSNSDKRVGLVVYPPAAGRATLSNDKQVVDGNGIVVTAGQGPVWLQLNMHGDVIQKEWYAVYSGASTPLGYIEVFE